MVDLSQLSDSDLLSLATKLKEAEANAPRDPLALSQAQLHAASGGVLEGLPVVGPYVKEGAERLGAKYDAATGAAPSETDALTQRKLATEKADRENSGALFAGRTIGSIAGTAPLVAAAPAAFGGGTAPLILRTGASMLSGGALGGADAAVRSSGDPVQTGIGAGVGAAAGPVGMAGGALYGKAAAAVADRLGGLTNPGGALSGISKAALRYASDAIGDPIKMAALQAEIKRLGPQATLADVSPEWFGVARGAASRPGMRDDIVNPLVARNDTKNPRLAADLEVLGPPRDPARLTAEIEARQQALSPDYERVLAGARRVDTTPLANRLEGLAVSERGGAQSAARDVRRMLNVAGTDELDPNPRTLLNTRHAIDGMLGKETDGNAVRVLTMARRYVDDQLTRAAPGIKDVDAFHQELARQKEALNAGGMVFDTGKTVSRPAAFAEDFVGSANPEGRLIGPSAAPFRQQQGARAEIDRLVNTKSNDPLAMQSAVKSEGDYPRDKLRTMFGDRADQALSAVDREAQFARTGGRITAGSDTAVTNQFGNFLNEASKPLEIPKGVTVLDLLGKGAEAGARKLFGIDPEAKARRFAEELGKLSVAQGAERNAYMRSLLDLVNKRGVLTPIENNAKEAMRALIISAASNRAPFKAPQ